MGLLRIAVWLAADAPVETWQARVIAGVVENPGLDLAAIVFDARKERETLADSLFGRILALDRLLFARGRLADPKSVEALIAGAPQIRIDHAGDGAWEALGAAGVDVILNLSLMAAPDEACALARSGVWEFDFAAETGRGKAVIGLAAHRRRAPVTPVRLYRRKASGVRLLLSEARCETKASLARTGALATDRAASIMLRELALAARGLGDEGATLLAENPEDRPGPTDAALYGGRLALAVARKGAERLAIAAAAGLGVLQPRFALYVGEGDVLSADFTQSRALPCARSAFFADPFVLTRDGARYVFFERLDYGRGKGVIAVGRLTEDGFELIGDALKADYHFSFPFVFEHEGDVYMLPETQEAQRLEVWRCVDFPLRWERCATALEGLSAVDSVLLENDGAWWLFTSISRGGQPEHCTELDVFRVDGPLLGDPRPHPRNPVVADVRTARGAGRIFRQGGRLIRPSQDNGGGVYGFGLNLMEITALDMERYEERPLRHIEGSHHVDVDGGCFVFDGRREVKTFGALGRTPALRGSGAATGGRTRPRPA